MQATRNIVIAFVPGTSASELNLNDKTRAWPDAIAPNHMVLPGDPLHKAVATTVDLTVGDLVDRFNILEIKQTPCYGSLIKYMQSTMKFTSAIASNCRPLKSATKPLTAPLERVFFHCPYDWRQTNEVSAKRLGDALTELDGVYTKGGQSYDLYIVGHSMGGLVSRCLLENPDTKKATWFGKAKALITLATPHYGAPLALRAILGQQLSPLELPAYVNFIKRVINNPDFPSTYELLPPPGHPFIADGSGKVQDIYSAAGSPLMNALTQFGFSAASMQKAQAFFSTLTTTSPDNTPIPYHCFVATEKDTLANDDAAHKLAFTYTAGQSKSDLAFKAAQSVPLGDGVVPAESARFVFAPNDPRCQTFPGYSHGQMGGSDMVKFPDAIRAMLKLIGLTALEAEPEAESETESEAEPAATQEAEPDAS